MADMDAVLEIPGQRVGIVLREEVAKRRRVFRPDFRILIQGVTMAAGASSRAALHAPAMRGKTSVGAMERRKGPDMDKALLSCARGTCRNSSLPGV